MKSIRVIIVAIVVMLLATGGAVWLFTRDYTIIASILIIVVFLLFWRVIRSVRKNYRDVYDFTEAVKYQDFTRRYVESSRGSKNIFYKNFNEISEVFADLNREKDAQQFYLRQILELVDTAIIAYNVESEEILWLNNAFKELFLIPDIKSLEWVKRRAPELYRELGCVRPSDPTIMNFNRDGVLLRLVINVSQFTTEMGQYRIIAIHNISSTMDEIEAKAWKGLLSVMTHEIMNSITPVVSLTETIRGRLSDLRADLKDKVSEEMSEIELGVETIRKRSEGLLKFSNTYHNLSRVIVPDIREADIVAIVENIRRLMYPSMDAKDIGFEIITKSSSVMVEVDSSLIEQAIINLITNAAHALKGVDNPKIELHVGEDKDLRPYITVADNGNGIPAEIQDKIYIPFFSTRKGGNGIGLTLTREIVKLHSASLLLQTKEGEGSAFTILLQPHSSLQDS